MNLWPFSKKMDSSPISPQQAEKMELPPGVMLASPDELELSPQQMAVTLPAPAAESESVAQAESSPLPAPLPSLEDLALLPMDSSTSAADESQDLASFFEKHQLEMISTGPQSSPDFQESAPSLASPESTVSAVPDLSAQLFSQPSFSQPLSGEGSLQEAASVGDDAWLGPDPISLDPAEALEAHSQVLPEQAAVSFLQDFQAGHSNSAESLDNFDLLPPQPHEQSTVLETSFSLGEAFDSLDSRIEPTLQSASPDAGSADAWMLPSGADPFALDANVDAIPATQTDPLSPDSQAFAEHGFSISLPELDTFDNLTPDNLAANFELAPSDSADDLGEQAFDLDSLLLGAADHPEAPLHAGAFSDTPIEADEPSDADILDHYFGDEAQGLKGNDNLESYDFGHYEDPDAPAEAFVLDGESPASILNNLSYDQYYCPPADDLSFSANVVSDPNWSDDDEAGPAESVNKEAAQTDYSAFLFSSEGVDNFPEHQGWPEFAAESPVPESMPETVVELETTAASLSTDLLVSSPSLQADPPDSSPDYALKQEVLAEEAMAQPALPEVRLDPGLSDEPVCSDGPSITNVMNTFSQDVLLHNNRFLGRSIDRLVSAYFAQQDEMSG